MIVGAGGIGGGVHALSGLREQGDGETGSLSDFGPSMDRRCPKRRLARQVLKGISRSRPRRKFVFLRRPRENWAVSRAESRLL
ncbi:hypothetical protein RB5724 [Rhodopirellula baltica SH 1]|uniref:Uncharacterized protein n=1 Tax=Rhodopirellula baltica (strain DSM 10527 / NCIMB 13988 / SH1) TaxID=243090 RepID=Q7URE3_RHOBA|nr:hypothetical protein RB5724 [Rhodopirellula baltica SH 1]